MGQEHGGGLRVIRDAPDTVLGASRFTRFDILGEVRDGSDGPPAPHLLAGGRIVPRDVTQRTAATRAALRAQLVELGAALDKDAADAPRGDSTIPAVFTYFGQFIAHDLTEPLAPEALNRAPEPPSAALDLGDIFRAVPRQPANGARAGACGFALGTTSRGRRADLARDAGGVPCIVDARNDNNLGCAQMTVTLMRFCEAVAAARPDLDPQAQRRLAMRHVQSVALHDYLPRIAGAELTAEILAEGRSVFRPRGVPARPGMLVPIEFSQAAFRVGHSMVRGMYRRWSPEIPRAELDELFDFTHLGRLRSPVHQPIDDDWVTDWTHLSDTADGRAAEVTSAALGDPLNYRFFWLDPAFFEPHDRARLDLVAGRIGVNLATFTLLRGLACDLAAAPEALATVNAALTARGRASVPVLPEEGILELHGPRTRAVLIGDGPFGRLIEAMPLWLYCLAEARSPRPGFGGGNRLGPLGARIVAEALHAAVEAADGGIVTADQRVAFRPDPALAGPGGGLRFTMAELLHATGPVSTPERTREEALA